MSRLGDLAQLIGSICLLGGYIPQIKKLYKTKKSKDISISFWLILTLGVGLINFNMLTKGIDLPVLLTQTGNTLLASWTTILVYKYRNN